MIKKKKQYQLQIILKLSLSKNNFELQLNKIISKNWEVKPSNRFIVTSDDFQGSFTHWKSYKKLKCLLSLNKRVPNKKYQLSRYYLTKFSDNLVISGFIKK